MGQKRIPLDYGKYKTSDRQTKTDSQRDRDKETETDRQKDRQTDRQTELWSVDTKTALIDAHLNAGIILVVTV